MESGAELEQRRDAPAAVHVARLASMMPPMIFRSVLLPEPLWPMRPTVSPSPISSDHVVEREELASATSIASPSRGCGP